MIRLERVIPYPLVGVFANNSSVWDTQLELLPHMHYLISAASGKGKSTLLSIIFGIRKDFHGDVFIDGKEVNTLKTPDWTKLRKDSFSMVYQDLRLLLNQTVEENLMLKAELYGTKAESKVERYADRLRIANLLKVPCSNLSYGERQRVAIIRSLLGPFKVLMLDEPFSHLDTVNIDLAGELIWDEVKQNNAMLLLASLGDTYGFTYDKTLNL